MPLGNHVLNVSMRVHVCAYGRAFVCVAEDPWLWRTIVLSPCYLGSLRRGLALK